MSTHWQDGTGEVFEISEGDPEIAKALLAAIWGADLDTLTPITQEAYVLRSIAFSWLLHGVPEFGKLASDDGSRLVTDAVLRITQDQAKDPSLTVDAILRQYVKDVSDGTEPGVWQRYVDSLKANDERHRPTPRVTWADEDGDLPLAGGGSGNPGCDCGMADAVVKVGTEYLCQAEAEQRGVRR